jgi:hypothetical protein
MRVRITCTIENTCPAIKKKTGYQVILIAYYFDNISGDLIISSLLILRRQE